MAHASKIGAAVYAAIPAFCREYKYYRQLTGKANLLLKKGLHDDEIIMRLIEKFVVPLKRQAIKGDRRERNKEKRKRNKRTLKPDYLRPYRHLKMVEWSIGDGEPSIYPSGAVDNLLHSLLEKIAATAPPFSHP